MHEYVLLIVGVLLIIASVVLVFLGRQGLTTVPILFFGVMMCLMPKPGSFGFKLPGFEGNVTATQVPETKTDVVAQIAPIQLNIQKLQDALAKQEAFNKTMTSSINKLEASAAGDHPAIVQPDINATSATFAANNQYSVFVFYKSPRATDAQTLVKGLIGAGFQASAIATSFLEAPQLSQDGSTFIVPTERGKKIGKDVEALAAKQGLPSVTLGDPYPVKRGDVQVFLY